MIALCFLSVHHLSSFLISWHGETKMLPRFTFKTCHSVPCRHLPHLPLSQASRAQSMVGTHGQMVTVDSLFPPLWFNVYFYCILWHPSSAIMIKQIQINGLITESAPLHLISVNACSLSFYFKLRYSLIIYRYCGPNNVFTVFLTEQSAIIAMFERKKGWFCFQPAVKDTGL